MRSFSVLLLLPAVLAYPHLEKRTDFSSWSPAKESDSRSPCPVLNAFANHNILPHSGKGITKEMMRSAFGSVRLSKLLADGLFNGANIKGMIVDGMLDLDRLTRHNAIEHDGSLSRGDTALGDNHIFNQTIFDEYLSHMEGLDMVPISVAGKARIARLQTEKARDPEFTYGPFQQFASNGETALYYSVLGDLDTAEVSKEYVRVLFEQERFPYAEGWRPQEHEVGLEEFGQILVKTIVESGEVLDALEIVTWPSLKELLRGLPGHWGLF